MVKEKSFRQKCIDAGVENINIYRFKQSNKGLSDEQLIELMLINKKKDNTIKKRESKLIGSYKIMNCGLGATVIDIDYTTEKIKVQFDDGETVISSRANFRSGSIGHPKYNTQTLNTVKKAQELIGQTIVTKYGEQIKIIDAKNKSKVQIEFVGTNVIRWTTYETFLSGNCQSKKCIIKKDTYTFKKYCEEQGVKYKTICNFVSNKYGGVCNLNGKEDYNRVLEEYNKIKRVNSNNNDSRTNKKIDDAIKKKLEDAQISKTVYLKFKAKHKDLDVEQIIELIKQFKNEKLIIGTMEFSNLKEISKQYKVDYNQLVHCRIQYNEISLAELIMKLNNDLSINIFGELIDINEA